MTANEAISYIHSFCWKGSKPGLSRTQELLNRLGNPQNELKFIHIVGTNGKGSTAAMLASVLQKAGYKTGLYTSPYIFRFHERMQMDGCDISDRMLAKCTELVMPHAEAMSDHPTEFELVTAIAMVYFELSGAEIVVLEAGMGGELDSTNVIPAPEAAIITNIGLDHTEYLGNTLEAIAATKAGIIKPGCDCVLYPCAPSVKAVVQEKCEKECVALHPVDKDAIRFLSGSFDGQLFHFGDFQNLKISLLGGHQLMNAAVVLTTLKVLQHRGWNIAESAIREGLADARWPGRFQLLHTKPVFIVDGGHNPQCMAALTKNIADYLAGKDLTILTGVMADKDQDAMYPPLLPYAKRFVTVTPDNPRAMAAEKLAEYLQGLGANAEACSTVLDGVRTAVEMAKANGGAVLACGSLYMVGEIAAAVKEILT